MGKIVTISIITILISTLLINNLSAQITINGCIANEKGDAFIGATILEINTLNSVFSDINGRFTISVQDSSKIRISSIGYYDTIIVASEFKDDTISMREVSLIDLPAWDYYIIIPSMSIGPNGDFNGLPYGIKLSAFIPYAFKKNIFIVTGAGIKTDFQSNTDLNLFIGRNIISKSNYKLSAYFNFHYRDLIKNNNKIKINDYELLIKNYLFDFITIYGGIVFRDSQIEDKGTFGIVGIGKQISKKRSYFSGELIFVNNDLEYTLSFYQGFLQKIHVLKDIEIGIVYKKYIKYDELNFLLTYSFHLK